jgi:hypothetical protein
MFCFEAKSGTGLIWAYSASLNFPSKAENLAGVSARKL